MKAPELDADALLQRISNALGDCLAIGSMNRKTGALGAHLSHSVRWRERLAQAAAGAGAIFPGVRVGAIAALLKELSEGKPSAIRFENVSLTAEDSRIVFQRCPWNQREVLFIVLPDNAGAETNFALFRLVLESVRRDVAIVRAPRVEERCWN